MTASDLAPVSEQPAVVNYYSASGTKMSLPAKRSTSRIHMVTIDSREETMLSTSLATKDLVSP